MSGLGGGLGVLGLAPSTHISQIKQKLLMGYKFTKYFIILLYIIFLHLNRVVNGIHKNSNFVFSEHATYYNIGFVIELVEFYRTFHSKR